MATQPSVDSGDPAGVPGTAEKGTAGVPGTAEKGTAGVPGTADKSVGDLVAAIKNDMTALVRGQVELAKAELRDEVKSASMGAAAIGVAIVLVSLAVVLLSIALVIVINNAGITLGWSFTIVGGGYLLLAAVLGIAAKAGFKKVVGPRRARASVEHAAQALRPSAQS